MSDNGKIRWADMDSDESDMGSCEQSDDNCDTSNDGEDIGVLDIDQLIITPDLMEGGICTTLEVPIDYALECGCPIYDFMRSYESGRAHMYIQDVWFTPLHVSHIVPG